MRLNNGSIAMTVSGYHKGRLKPDHIMRINMSGEALEDKKPSDEAILHVQLYKLFPQINAILHVHSLPGVVLTRALSGDVTLAGYEMLKIFPHIDTHETSITIPVFENSQDMMVLGADVEKKISDDVPAYLIRDHGFYAWSSDMEHCVNMCEALDYLLTCELEFLKVKAGGVKP